MWQIVYFFKEAFLGFRGNSAAVAITTVVIALTMMLAGLFLLVYLNLDALVGSLRQQIKVVLYLDDSVSDKATRELREKLQQKKGVLKVSYTSKKQALEDFRRLSEGNDLLLKGLGKNPLPASFELELEESFRSPDAIQRLTEQVRRIEGIENVHYGREWVERLSAVLSVLRAGATVGGLILGLVAVVIISSTIGLTVWGRLADIEILKLIGATRTYIQMPFLLEGMAMGLIGGASALFLLRVIYELVQRRFIETSHFLGEMNLIFLPTQWLALFLVAGVGMGLTGSLISIRRYL